jgi:antitoxin (DNA-binding transcriptional repressor) of toxin-antitoxin stability system
VAAIALRACSILGLAPVNTGMLLTDEAPLDLGTEDGARLRLHVTEGTKTELSSGGVPLARIVALAEDLTADPSAARVEEALTRTFLMCRATETPTVVAYPGRPAGRADLPPKLRRLTHWIGPFPAGTGAPSALLGVVPVSPLEIESTERMARALRWTWYATWLLEMGRLTARIDERSSESQRSPRRTLGGISGEVVRVGELTRLLTPCPLCRKTKRVSFDPGQRGAFRYLCADCDGQWGIRICGTCQRLFPVLTDSKPAGANEDHDPYDTGDKIDARFGSDVLALPCPSFPDWTRFRCPWCGTCQGSPSCRCDYTV